MSWLLVALVATSGGTPSPAGSPSPAAVASATPTSSPSPSPSPTPTPTPTPSPSLTPTPTPTPNPSPNPNASPSPTPGPRGAGIGTPVLFRGECTPGGGPGACRVTAMGVPGEGGTMLPIPCTDEKATRVKIADRYFRPGTELDLYVRGAPTGSFVVATEEPGTSGCEARANGRRHGAPGSTYDFIALFPDDAVKLGPMRFPMKPQPDARSVAKLALGDKASGGLSLRAVRRMTDGAQQILVADVALAGGGHAVVIAEGSGTDPAAWKGVWSDVTDSSQPALFLVDAFDLGADGHPKVLLERPKKGGALEWILLRRDAKGWH